MSLAKSHLHIVLNIALSLLITNVQTASVGDYSDLLSNLYKKAAIEDRPIVLILDNNHHHHNKQSTRQSSDKNDDGEDVPYPFLYLYKLAHEAKAASNINDGKNDDKNDDRNDDRNDDNSSNRNYARNDNRSYNRYWNSRNEDR